MFMITASILHIYPWDTQLLQGCWYLYNSINLDSALQTQYAVVVINSGAAGQNFQLALVSYTPQIRCVAQVKELKERKYSYQAIKIPHVSLPISGGEMEGQTSTKEKEISQSLRVNGNI